MKNLIYISIFFCFTFCNTKKENVNKTLDMTAEKLLGNPDYQAISYGAYRKNSRDIQPTFAQLKEDMLILSAMNIKFIRTYNVHYDEVKNLLEVIETLKKENPKFEMYVMLGAWIDCKNAWTDKPVIHNEESDRNATEIEECVRLANKHPEIIKVIAVGNEAMVNWAASYFVTPDIILKWVNHLQKLKKETKLPKDLWITSSDNFASWGGGDSIYHVEDLKKLYQAVDYISIHTYPMHDTHYNPVFWGILPEENNLSDKEKIDLAMIRAIDYAKNQYKSVKDYMKSIGVNKPIHIGETGWATSCNELYGNNGSKATDEYKSGKYYELLREWTNKEKISCFYFEAFDEIWKDKGNPEGSENHFGLFTVNGKAKYAIWNLANSNIFKGLTRDGNTITNTFNGDETELWKTIKLPKTKEN